jgi:DNA-directed RNA polymerase specialized sigma subunit
MSEALSEEPELKKIVEMIWHEDASRSDIAKKLGMTPEQVTQAKRKIARRLADLRDKFFS